MGVDVEMLRHLAAPHDPPEVEIEDHEVRLTQLELGDGPDRRPRAVDGVTPPFQHLHVDCAQIFVVFDHQNAGHYGFATVGVGAAGGGAAGVDGEVEFVEFTNVNPSAGNVDAAAPTHARIGCPDEENDASMAELALTSAKSSERINAGEVNMGAF